MQGDTWAKCWGALLGVILICGLVAAVASCAEPLGRSEPPCGATRFTAERWYDADTAKGVTFHFALGVSIRDDDGLRIDNGDAWEVGHRPGVTVTDEERAKGRRALLHLRDTFDESAGYVEFNKQQRDGRGRPLGRVWLRRKSDGRWVDLGQWLQANGHDRSGT